MEAVIGIIKFALIISVVIGWIWIMGTAFREGETLWVIGCLIFYPLSLVYGFLNFQELKTPFFMMLFGFLGQIAMIVSSA